jgi:hypothetical protein
LPQVVMLEDDEFDAFLWIVAQSPENGTQGDAVPRQEQFFRWSLGATGDVIGKSEARMATIRKEITNFLPNEAAGAIDAMMGKARP